MPASRAPRLFLRAKAGGRSRVRSAERARTPFKDTTMKRLCQCGTLVPKGERCPCQRAKAKAKDAERGSAASRGYDDEWRALRRQFIAAYPNCKVCGQPAKHVDHIKTIREAPHLRLDPRNLRSLCHPCHSRHTATSLPFGRNNIA